MSAGNVKRRYSEFLSFKIKVHSKGNKQVVQSHISDKQLKTKKKVLVKQIKRIKHPKKNQAEEIWQYNKMVTGMHNYYQIATHISLDMNKINRTVMAVITNRLDEPIYPIGYVQHKIPMERSGKINVLRDLVGNKPLKVD